MELFISNLQKENVKFSCLRTPKIISLLNGLKHHFCAFLIAQLVKKKSSCSAEDPGSIPGLGRSAGERDRLPTPVFLGFPCGSAGKQSGCNAGDLGSISGLGRYPGEGKGSPLQYSGLENPMDSPWAHKESDTTERLSLLLPLLIAHDVAF